MTTCDAADLGGRFATIGMCGMIESKLATAESANMTEPGDELEADVEKILRSFLIPRNRDFQQLPHRKPDLSNIKMGDILYATSPNGANLICLVTLVTEDAIHTRTVTSQYRLTFDSKSGEAEHYETGALCRIDSTAPLPTDIHSIMLSLDRKFRLEFREDNFRLTQSEKDALLFIDRYYKEN